MKNRITTLAVIVCSLFALTSCSKEDSTTTTAGTDITGTYKYVSNQAKTSSSIQTTDGADVEKTVTTSDYTTLNNTGTLTIDATKLVTSNVGYSINGTANSTLYENGVLSGNYSLPFQFTLPPTSGTTTYKRIGADSLYLASGTVVIGGASTVAQPAGCRIKLENGTLTLTSNVTQTTNTVEQGIKVTTIIAAQSVTTLQKQ